MNLPPSRSCEKGAAMPVINVRERTAATAADVGSFIFFGKSKHIGCEEIEKTPFLYRPLWPRLRDNHVGEENRPRPKRDDH